MTDWLNNIPNGRTVLIAIYGNAVNNFTCEGYSNLLGAIKTLGAD